MSDIKPVRPPKRDRRRLRTPNPEVRERLMAAGADLINEQGFPALRIEELAERAGLSVGTFYLYFEGKADFFVNLVIDYTERLRTRLRVAREGPGTLAERLTRGLDAYLDFVLENERGFLYFRDAGNIDTNVGKLSTWALNTHAGDLQPLLEEAMERGEMRREDPALLAQALVGVTQHVAGVWLEHKDAYPRDTIRRFLLAFTANAAAS